MLSGSGPTNAARTWAVSPANSGATGRWRPGKLQFTARARPSSFFALAHGTRGLVACALTRPLLAVGGAKIPIHVAPTELARASRVLVAIHMALLPELDLSPSPKMHIGCMAHRLRKLGLDAETALANPSTAARRQSRRKVIWISLPDRK